VPEFTNSTKASNGLPPLNGVSAETRLRFMPTRHSGRGQYHKAKYMPLKTLPPKTLWPKTLLSESAPGIPSELYIGLLEA
jgi:hypothetical protein